MNNNKHDIRLVFKNRLIGNVYDNHGNIVDSVNESNMLTNKATNILTYNVMGAINTPAESNKIVGIILSDSEVDKDKSITITDFINQSDNVERIPYTNITYMGMGDITYGARYSFVINNTGPDSLNYKTFGLITGDDITNPTSHKLFSILNCNIMIAAGGSFTGAYVLTTAIRR